MRHFNSLDRIDFLPENMSCGEDSRIYELIQALATTQCSGTVSHPIRLQLLLCLQILNSLPCNIWEQTPLQQSQEITIPSFFIERGRQNSLGQTPAVSILKGAKTGVTQGAIYSVDAATAEWADSITERSWSKCEA